MTQKPGDIRYGQWHKQRRARSTYMYVYLYEGTWGVSEGQGQILKTQSLKDHQLSSAEIL